MAMKPEPLVSVVTPAYNRGDFLAECIASAQVQSYRNWEYVIVDNCSTDDTLAVAQSYAASDERIKVYRNDALLDVNSSHNRAFGLISPASKYCKVVSADDWLFPECLERMVAVAEQHPSVGLVGSYQLSGGGQNWWDWSVRWDQVPYPTGVIPGRNVCRLYMLGGIEVFGSPTSLLYRADLVRRQEKFFPNQGVHADTSACCMTLLEHDYGFVHQVLSYERVHDVRVTTDCQDLNSYLPCQIGDVLEYGEACLTPIEREQALRRLMTQYYDYLAVGALKLRDHRFWDYHMTRLREIGQPLSQLRLAGAIGKVAARMMLDPWRLVRAVARHVRPRVPQPQ